MNPVESDHHLGRPAPALAPRLPGAGFPSAAAAVALLVGALLAGCSGEPEAPPSEPREVRYVTVGEGEEVRARILSGTSKASLQSRLSFKVSGTLTELPIEVGDRLRRGQLVARIDPFQYELEVERAEADLVRARSAERNARTTYDRTKELYADNNASRGDLDNARANAESAVAQTRSAEKMVELSRLQVSYTELRAATDCSVASIGVEVNENVGNGSTVALVNCGDALEVEASVPESLIGDLAEGLEATVRFDAIPEQPFTGKLTEVGVAGEGGATFPITVSIEGAHPELRSGLAAEVRFDLDRETRDVLLIPSSAAVRGADETYVFLAEEAGGQGASTRGNARVTKRPIVLGELTAGGLEVVSGLQPGDRVITAGLSSIYEGLEVRISTDTSESAR